MQPQHAEEREEDELESGDLVAGRFQIVRTLGRGGMATVYEARHEITRRPFALKIANQKLVNNQLLSGRFLREARTASTIRHAHAIEVSDVFETEEGRPVMVMELLQGCDLAATIAEAGRLSPAEVADVFVPVLSALAHAHAEGIIHRDMKPDNIFLSEVDGEVVPKVLDFGIAKVVGEAVDSDLKLTSTGMLLGTPFYMSPEQVSGREDLDHLADIWSVGVCMYEALTGELPFQGTNFGQVFAAILQAEPSEMSASVPPELEGLVRRCLEKKPEDRPSDCGELAEALRAYGGPGTGKYPAPATASGRYDAVRAPEARGEAPTLAAEEGPSLFDDTTMNVRRPPAAARTKLVVAGIVVAALLVGGAFLWARPDANDAATAPTSALDEVDEAMSEPTADDARVAPTQEIEEIEEVDPNEVTEGSAAGSAEAVSDPESAASQSPRTEPATPMTVRMTRRRPSMQATMTAAMSDPATSMSGIIDEL